MVFCGVSWLKVLNGWLLFCLMLGLVIVVVIFLIWRGDFFFFCCFLLFLLMSDFMVILGVVVNIGLKNNVNNYIDKLVKYSGNLLV